ncbi:MAG: hypothetical protein ACE5HP_06665 [Gemmatimonadota bacterium]
MSAEPRIVPPDASGRRADPPWRPAIAPSRRDRERPYRRALRLGLVASLLLHAVVLVIAGHLRFDRRPPATSPRTEPERQEGLLVVLLRLLEPPPSSSEAPRQPPEEATPPARLPSEETVPVLAPGAEPEEEGEVALTNAERLQPRMGDERLWVDFMDPISVHTSERLDRAVDVLRRLVREWLDSLALTEDQRRRALDWTFGEGSNRWGISPEGLHLGDVVIPIPFGQFLSETGPRSREARQAMRDLQEIQAQDVRAQIEKTIRERREEMRRRSEEEAKRREQRDTTSGGS